MHVRLDHRQRRFARAIASRRFALGGMQQYGACAGFWLDRGSCEAELAVSIGTGLPWTAVFARGGADVGDNLEVRWTSRWTGRLIVHPSDPDEYLGVLVTPGFSEGELRIIGWLECARAKQRRFVDEPRPGGRAFFVPQTELRPIEDLVA